MNKNHIWLLMALSILSAGSVNADTQKMDLLLGIGDFANSTYTKRSEGWRWGDPCLPNDTVANGWTRYITDPMSSDKFVCNLTEKPGYQYMALKNITSGGGWLELATSATVDDSDSYRPHVGDTVTLVVDKIKMRDWVASKTSFAISLYSPSLPWTTQNVSYSSKDISSSISMVVPDGATQVVVSIRLRSTGDISGHEPGVFVSGAHLYLTRAGNKPQEVEDIPATKNRNIATNCYGWSEAVQGIRPGAAQFDEIITGAWYYPYYPALRKMGPTAKIYLYQGVTCVDTSWDNCWAICPLRFSDAKASHSNWLYAGSPGLAGYLYDPTYHDRFHLHLANKDYQNYWASTILDKARTLGVDGIFVDDCGALTVAHQGIKRDPYEVQQFLHAVVPKLKAAGLNVMVNAAGTNLDGTLSWNDDPPLAYFDPTWKPSGAYTESIGYSANTPNNTPDAFFQEFAFLNHGFRVNQKYWLKCIYDASVVAKWNASLIASQCKRLCYFVNQKDTSDHPAYGLDGWINFALASYLLCQNSYTSFGVAIDGAVPVDVDFSVTKRLGVPSSTNFANLGDTYCQWRRYMATDDGGVGGVVVVNGNETVSRKYTLDFDAEDQSGNVYDQGTKITLAPHTGRIFFQRQLLDVALSVPDEDVTSGQIITVTVQYTNESSTAVKNVTVRAQVPDQMDYVTGSAEKSAGRYYSDTKTIVWTISSLIAGGKGTKTFKVIVK